MNTVPTMSVKTTEFKPSVTAKPWTPGGAPTQPKMSTSAGTFIPNKPP